MQFRAINVTLLRPLDARMELFLFRIRRSSLSLVIMSLMLNFALNGFSLEVHTFDDIFFVSSVCLLSLSFKALALVFYLHVSTNFQFCLQYQIRSSQNQRDRFSFLKVYAFEIFIQVFDRKFSIVKNFFNDENIFNFFLNQTTQISYKKSSKNCFWFGLENLVWQKCF